MGKRNDAASEDLLASNNRIQDDAFCQKPPKIAVDRFEILNLLDTVDGSSLALIELLGDIEALNIDQIFKGFVAKRSQMRSRAGRNTTCDRTAIQHG